MVDMNAYREININILCDQSYFSNTTNNIKILVVELDKIQGNNEFRHCQAARSAKELAEYFISANGYMPNKQYSAHK